MPKDMTKSAIERQMLDAYFHFRSNLPKKDEESGLDYKKSFKTTEDIASDLSTMATIDPETIAPPKGLDPSRVEGTCCAAFAFGGNRRNMASLIALLMRESQDFRNLLTLGINGFTTKEGK